VPKSQQKRPQPPAKQGAPLASEEDNPDRRRRNVWEPQVMPPQTVDLPLRDGDDADIAVPAAISGQSLLDTRR
jgi:hypothetical protein